MRETKSGKQIIKCHHYFYDAASYEDDKSISSLPDDHVIWDRHYTLKVSTNFKYISVGLLEI